MKEFKESLIVGKFYPPHLGHHYLIDTALERSEHVTVVVMGTSFDTISVYERTKMILAVHGNNGSLTVQPVLDHVYDDFEDGTVWKAHNTTIENALTTRPDAVFTSENYGDELAQYFDAKHVCVDIDRKRYPISATSIRKNVYGQWRFLHPEVRKNFRLKIVVMGAESTGTTTLCKALRKHYSGLGGVFTDTPHVPEYGREYAEKKVLEEGIPEGLDDIVFTNEDFWNIVEGQRELYKEMTGSTKSPVIISDTDTIATEAFAPYYGVHPDAGERDYGFDDYSDSRGVIYLITDHVGLPLTADGTRRKDTEIRDASTQEFINTCRKYELPYALITGTRTHRRDVAVKIIDKLLKMNAFMRPPL